MQNCELLKFMSVDDLAQRYEGTIVQYGGDWITVTAFKQMDTGILLHYRDVKANPHQTQFNWQFLNTERLPSRWYYRDESFAAFLSYVPARQWKRGYANGNTRLYHPNGAMMLRTDYAAKFYEQAGKTVINQFRDPQTLSARLKEGDVILSEDFCLTYTGDLCYKEYIIGKWKQKLLKIELRDPLFLDEMRDLGMVHLLATDKELKDIQEPPKEMKVDRDWAAELKQALREADAHLRNNAVNAAPPRVNPVAGPDLIPVGFVIDDEINHQDD